MRAKSTLCLLITLLVIQVNMDAQVAYTLETGSGMAGACYLPTANYTIGGPSARGRLPLDEYGNLPTISGLPTQAGGMAIDQKTGTIYSTNGYVVQQEGHPYYLAPSITYSAGLSVYAPSGTLNGLAVDAKNNILYAVGNDHLLQFDATTLLILSTPIHLSWLNAGTKLSGLGYDPDTGTLWACDLSGHVYEMMPDGTPVGPQPRSTVTTSSPLRGLAINTSNGISAMSAPFCSFQVSGYHVLVTDGTGIRDAMNPIGWPLSIGGNNTAVGLAFCSDAQLIPASSACPLNAWAIGVGGGSGGGGAAVGVGTGLPFTAAIPNTIELNGAPSNAWAKLLVDLCPIQGGIALPTGDIAYVWALSPTTISFNMMTNAWGRASFAVPAFVVPPGLQVTVQWYFQDPSNPTLYGCFSDAAVLVAGRG